MIRLLTLVSLCLDWCRRCYSDRGFHRVTRFRDYVIYGYLMVTLVVLRTVRYSDDASVRQMVAFS